jgi:hypothetical protein
VNGAWPWLALAAAGAFHGLNPAMGWLFAVDAGMQDRSRGALLRSLPFIAAGHALSIGMFVVAIGTLGILVAPHTLQLACAGVLVGFGMWKAFHWCRERECAGSRVGPRALVAWSFLMATSHGAGLMLVPVLLHTPASFAYLKVPNQHVLALGWALPSVSTAVGGVAIHTAAMLSVAAILAVIVYQTVGVQVVGRAWRNLDLPWAASLVGAGVLMAVL